MSNTSPVTSLNEGRCDMDLRGALLSSSSGATSSHLVLKYFSRVALYICWLCNRATAPPPPPRPKEFGTCAKACAHAFEMWRLTKT